MLLNVGAEAGVGFKSMEGSMTVLESVVPTLLLSICFVYQQVVMSDYSFSIIHYGKLQRIGPWKWQSLVKAKRLGGHQ